jgi:hypothetical protein
MKVSTLTFASTWLLLTMVSTLALASPNEQICIDRSASIEEKLACIEGLTFKDASTDEGTPAGVRRFDLQYEQPVDHSNKDAGIFSQKLVLLHRSESEPMTLQTSGYQIFGVKLTALASMFGTNQLQIEHRFFAGSSPKELDWSKLNVKQSADDFHRITVAFKQIYTKPWVNTGASKGGMTSVFHRRYYPDDLAGTVADVAPLSFSTSDERYIDFVENVGGDTYKICRENLKKLQLTLLENRADLVPMLRGDFTFLGSADIAFEHSVVEFPFIFWQYQRPTDPMVGCDKIPVDGTPKDAFDYLQKVNGISMYTDPDLNQFLPYYFQAATQLGNPGTDDTYLGELKLYDFKIDQYTPKGVDYSYTNELMIDVKNWVTSESKDIIFVYGEFDPWSAGAFPVRKEAGSFKFFAPAGNHGAKFTSLNAEDKATAIRTLSGWLGKQPVDSKSRSKGETLEDLEFKALRKHRMR